jgi:hypothetical protein
MRLRAAQAAPIRRSEDRTNYHYLRKRVIPNRRVAAREQSAVPLILATTPAAHPKSSFRTRVLSAGEGSAFPPPDLGNQQEYACDRGSQFNPNTSFRASEDYRRIFRLLAEDDPTSASQRKRR